MSASHFLTVEHSSNMGEQLYCVNLRVLGKIKNNNKDFRVVASPRGRKSIKRTRLTPSQLQGVWQNFTHFILDDFSAFPGAGIKIFDIFHKSVDYEVLDFIHV